MDRESVGIVRGNWGPARLELERPVVNGDAAPDLLFKRVGPRSKPPVKDAEARAEAMTSSEGSTSSSIRAHRAGGPINSLRVRLRQLGDEDSSALSALLRGDRSPSVRVSRGDARSRKSPA